MEAPAAENRSMASILSETGRICRDFHRLFTGNVVLVVFAKQERGDPSEKAKRHQTGKEF